MASKQRDIQREQDQRDSAKSKAGAGQKQKQPVQAGAREQPAELPLMPTVLGHGRPTVRVSTSHRVPYGTFREDR